MRVYLWLQWELLGVLYLDPSTLRAASIVGLEVDFAGEEGKGGGLCSWEKGCCDHGGKKERQEGWKNSPTYILVPSTEHIL
jgi:hypothetical protein